MRYTFIILSLVVGLFSETKAQIAANWKVGTWSQFKTAAVSYTMDDDCAHQLITVVPMFDKYNYKTTLFTVITWSPNWPGLIAASANGHEVASHTMTHPTLNTVSVTSQNTELGQSQADILAEIPNKRCDVVAYPNCVEGDLPTIQKYYIAGRTCNNQVENPTPNDFYDVGSIITGTQGPVQVTADFNTRVQSAKASGGWCVFLTHAIDSDNGYSPTQSSQIEAHLAYMNSNIQYYWIAPFGTVIKYIKERNGASIAETAITSDSLKMTITTSLDTTIYNVPVTVSRVLPTGWKTPKVYIGGKRATSKDTVMGGTTYIMFDVVPNKGNVYLANTSSVVATAAPTVTSPVTYCQNAKAIALTATASAGGTLNWYTVATAGTSSATAPTPSTAATGTTSYYVSQTVSGVESPRATIAVTVNAIPAAPTVTSAVSYCQNATATALTATATGTLNWYTVATNGTSSATAPTPATTTAGTTSYYVSQTTNACESPRASIAVTVNAIPAAPTVTSPVAYCQNATATALTATGTALKWYTVATAGTSSATAPTPATTATGTTSYYVSQTTNACESPRASIAVTVNGIPTAPTVTSQVSYCQNATATALTATATGTLNWYTVSTGGTASATAPTPATTATGTTSYYVSQTNTGCESPRAAIAVTVNAIPVAPTVSAVSYCQNATATALTATGTGTLNWYTVATNGTSSATAPTPATTTTGTTSYYVSQTTTGCESPRASIAVTVNAIPTAPTVTSAVSYCQNATATALTATATGTLNWYTVATNGTSSATAPTPTTTATGTTSYYVSQTTNSCESPRAAIAVTVSAPPTASNAGNAQYITNPSANLSANVPTTGAGTWTVVNGTATFANSSSATTSVSGLSSGANVLQWTIANGSCPSSSSTVTINVGTSPSTQTITGPTQVTTNATGVIYSVSDDNGSHYKWTLPTGATIASHNADSSQITVNYGTSGGTVSVTETNSYGTASSSLPVSVGNAPSTQTITGSATVTTNETGVAYSVPDNNGSHYLWSLPTGATIASHNADSSQITVDYGTSGGTVSLTETNPYGTATSSLPVSVGNAPTSQTITGPAYVTPNETGVAYSVPDDNGSHYKWTLPTGATIASHNADSSQITVDYGTTGGTVSVTETNPYGTASSSLPVSVGNAPTTQTITGEIYVPMNSTGVAYSVPDNNGSHYLWSLPTGATIASHNADSSQITVNYGTSGGTVSVTETNPYGTATSTVTVSVGATPTTQIITGPATVTANETGVAYSVPDNNGSHYLWSLPTGATITSHNADSSQITVNYGTTGGTISVTETNPYGNATSTLPVSISSTTAVIAGSAGDSYEVKPNPFSDYTTIIVHHSTTEQITLSVINVQGVSCYTSSQYYTNQEFTIGSELTADGVYFVQLSYGAEVKVLKLVKVR